MVVLKVSRFGNTIVWGFFTFLIAFAVLLSPVGVYAAPSGLKVLSTKALAKLRQKLKRNPCLNLKLKKKIKQKKCRGVRAASVPLTWYSHRYNTDTNVRTGNVYPNDKLAMNETVCLIVHNVSKVVFTVGETSLTTRADLNSWRPLCAGGMVDNNLLPMRVNPGYYPMTYQFFGIGGDLIGFYETTVTIVPGATGASITPTPVPTATATATATATPTATSTPTPVVTTANFLLGLTNISSDFNNVDRTVSLLRDELGANSIRGWKTMRPGTTPTWGEFDYYRTMRSRGLATVVTFNLPENTPSSGLPTAEQTRAYFRSAISAASGAVDYWSIGNEVNYAHYWPGTLSQYMNQFLIPASQELRRANQLVVGASISWDAARVRDLVNLGMLNYVDAVAYHPYAPDAAGSVSRVREVLGYIQGKPLFITEFNTYTGQNMWDSANHMQQLSAGFAGVKNLVAGLWVYNPTYRNDYAAVGAPYDNYGNRRFPYFCTYFKMFRGFNSWLNECK